MPEYADPVIDWLDPDKNLITKRFFRQVRNDLLINILSYTATLELLAAHISTG